MARPVIVAGVASLVVGLGLLVHHAAKHGYLMDEMDSWKNHEFFVALFAALGGGLLIGASVK